MSNGIAQAAGQSEPTVEPMRLTLGPGGRVGVKEGDTLIGAFDGTELEVFSLMELVRRLQEITEKYHPEHVSLVDEFLRERRAMWGEED